MSCGLGARYRIAIDHYSPHLRSRRKSNERVPSWAYDPIAEELYAVHKRILDFPTPGTPQPSSVEPKFRTLLDLTAHAVGSDAKKNITALRVPLVTLQRELWPARAEVVLLHRRCDDLDRVPRWAITGNTASPVLRCIATSDYDAKRHRKPVANTVSERHDDALTDATSYCLIHWYTIADAVAVVDAEPLAHALSQSDAKPYAERNVEFHADTIADPHAIAVVDRFSDADPVANALAHGHADDVRQPERDRYT